MTSLMITPYPPYRDGIAVYAAQEVRARRGAGEDLEVLSPLPSAAHHHLVLGGPKGWTRLLRRLAPFDKLTIQLYPELLHGACRNPVERVATWVALEAVCRRCPTELRVHEVDHSPPRRNPLERAAAARALRAADAVSVHTDAERVELCETFGLSPTEVTIVDHGRHFTSRTIGSRADARAELGLSADAHLFLAIGFLQSHKGFDRAVRAFAQAALPGAELHVVGSVRLDVPEFVAYAASLRRQIDAVPGAVFHERYVSDDEFDRWLIAADTVVLPYREIFSSGVLERAKLLGRPVIASRVGGLEAQLGSDSESFGDEDELATAMARRAGSQAGADAGAVRAASSLTPDTASIEAHVRSSVTAGRPVRVLDFGGELALPPPTSHRPLVGRAKRAVRMVTGWQLVPIVERVNRLEAELERQLERKPTQSE